MKTFITEIKKEGILYAGQKIKAKSYADAKFTAKLINPDLKILGVILKET